MCLLSSCGTIFSESSYDVRINSNPQGAQFRVYDRDHREISSGSPPQTIHLYSGSGYFTKAHYSVLFSGDNGEEVGLPITFQVDGWYNTGNLIVDPLTGAMYTIDHNELTANLGKSSSFNNNKEELRKMSLDELPGHQ